MVSLEERLVVASVIESVTLCGFALRDELNETEEDIVVEIDRVDRMDRVEDFFTLISLVQDSVSDNEFDVVGLLSEPDMVLEVLKETVQLLVASESEFVAENPSDLDLDLDVVLVL